jgi:hypothetical protein
MKNERTKRPEDAGASSEHSLVVLALPLANRMQQKLTNELFATRWWWWWVENKSVEFEIQQEIVKYTYLRPNQRVSCF